MGAISPDVEDITIQVRDGSGQIYYEDTIPAGTLNASPFGRAFVYRDLRPPFEINNLKKARIAFRRDKVTGRYVFRMLRLTTPPPQSGTGSVTIRIGGLCFEDPADVCTPRLRGVVCK